MSSIEGDVVSDPEEGPSHSDGKSSIQLKFQKTLTILDGTFFKIIPEKCTNDQVVANCVKCEPKMTEIKGKMCASSNFLSHLKRKHSEFVEEYKEYVASKKRKISNLNSEDTRKKPTVKTKSQEELNKDLTLFFVHSMVPLRTIEDPYFLAMMTNLGVTTKFKIMSRRSLGREINMLFEQQKEQIKSTLKNVQYVCTTADVWSSKKRSFFGVTVHWLDCRTYERRAACLACRRLRDRHTFDKIADMLNIIHCEFGLTTNKIVATVTDNGSNFVKAFKIFGAKKLNDLNSSEDSSNNSEEDDNDMCEETDNEYVSLSIPELSISSLPKHLRCCAHILNLCATMDINKGIESSSSLVDIHKQFSKSVRLCGTRLEDRIHLIIIKILGHTLSKPGQTRWNSTFDALEQIYKIKHKSGDLFRALGKKYQPLKEYEFCYIREYLECLRPIAQALDILQGEKDIHYGVTLPCILSLQRKLTNLKEKDWVFCKPLINTLVKSLELRFQDNYLNFSSDTARNASIASFSHPQMKKRWLAFVPSKFHDSLLLYFKKAVSKSYAKLHDTKDIPATSSFRNSKIEKFLDFDVVNKEQTDPEMAASEHLIAQYFQDPNSELKSLDAYPAIKFIFIKYNTPIPSSAPVERIFSLATLTNMPKSNKLSDSMFEKRVFLKGNMNYQPSVGKEN